ncbi:hypothetical protein LOK49_Contig8G00009 [Camellia lanceoleosa]|nr:hypothetical protein LOK49_Contig8G00009 [Camellia lanceoleosa]
MDKNKPGPRFWSCHKIFAAEWPAKVLKPAGLSYCWLWLHNMYWEFRGT